MGPPPLIIASPAREAMLVARAIRENLEREERRYATNPL